MKITIIFLAFFFFWPYFLYSQPNTLYFMKGVPQTKDLNPARPVISSGFYFSMPLLSKIDLSLNTNNWSYNDLIHSGTNPSPFGINWDLSDSLVIDIDKFRGSLDNNNFIFESAALTVLEGGYKKGANFFGLSITEKEFAELDFHKNLINLIEFGNYPYIGQSFYSGNLGINLQHYREFVFNYSREVSSNLTIGAAAKILFGLGAFHTKGINMKVASPVNGDYLDVSLAGIINISAPVDINYDNWGMPSAVNVLPNYTLRDYLSNFHNPGVALDLGFAYQLNKKTELSASIIDLGMIGWNTNETRLTEHGSYLYRGINLNELLLQLRPLVTELRDSIYTVFRPDTVGSKFSTLLPPKIFFGIEYQLNDIVGLAGLGRARIFGNTVHTSLTVSANAYILNGLSFSTSYSLMESTFDNIGFGLGIRIRRVQVYAASDNLFSPFYPSKARNISLRLGINFIFDDREKRKSSSSLNPNCHCPYEW